MVNKTITEDEISDFNKIALHPLQTYEWGEFRKKTGLKVIRRGFFEKDPSTNPGQTKLTDGFQLTIHKIPHTPWTIGYLPKGNMPTKEVVGELKVIGRQENCIFIQLEPDVIKTSNFELRTSNLGLRPAAHPLFTKYTFMLDLTKSEDELLKNMHPKTRYNIKVAQKHNVEVKEDNSDEAFETFLRLNQETTTRQKFYAHPNSFFRKMRDTLQETNNQRLTINDLTMHLFTAIYQKTTLVSWILFTLKDTLYYPYGASSTLHRDVMASNLLMWEAIKFGKKLGLRKFDMWGSLGPDASQKDPMFGFHQFKERYGATLTEYVGSYDLIINPLLYQGYKLADKVRWLYLKLKR